MKYNELIKELEYWKAISDEENPEVVIVYNHNDSIGIDKIEPAPGLENKTAIGIYEDY